MYVIEEDISIERLMGTVNDIVTEDVEKNYGDVNMHRLTEKVLNDLKLRSCRLSNLYVNGKVQPLPDLAKKISCATNLAGACMEVEWAKPVVSQVSLQMDSLTHESCVAVPAIPLDLDSVDSVTIVHNQHISMETSERMVRRMTQRCNFYMTF